MTPRTHSHTDVAVRPKLGPLIKACLGVQFPAKESAHFLQIIKGYRLGRAADGALLAHPTEILNPDVDGAIRNEGQVRGDASQTHSWPKRLGDQEAKTAHLAQPGVYR